MKAVVIVLAVLLALAHPAALPAVVTAELTACGVLGGLIWRAVRLHPCLYWRTA